MRLRKRLIIVVTTVLLAIGSMAEAEEGPRRTIESAAEALRSALADPVQREEALRRVLSSLFDLEAMALDALGDQVGTLSPEDRREYLALMERLVTQSLSRQVARSFTFQLRFGAITVFERRARVETFVVVTTTQEETSDVIFELHLREGRWRVVEVAIDGDALLRGYRLIFSRILAHGGVDELLRRMRARLERGR